MVLQGHIENGRIVFDAPPDLPEGARVQLEVVSRTDSIKAVVAKFRDQPETSSTLTERLAPMIGTGRGLPADLAERHDHYIHGTGE